MTRRFDDAKKRLDAYLAMTDMRRTPERDAILQTICSFEGQFTLDELNVALADNKFIVSRGTLYNTLRLFMKINLVVRHRVASKTTFAMTSPGHGQCLEVCSLCGKTTSVSLPSMEKALSDVSLHRFRKEGYTLYIYGLCSSCQAKLTRMKAANNQTKQING
jgi:Fur family ferric uptake transcriptional regulator